MVQDLGGVNLSDRPRQLPKRHFNLDKNMEVPIRMRSKSALRFPGRKHG